jgi:Domain of unknown function (DUF4112)
VVYHTLAYWQIEVLFYTSSISRSENPMTDRSYSISTELSEDAIGRLAHLRTLSNFWDNALRIPGTKMRVGLDSVMGVLPFGGDLLGMILSCYILFHAVRFQLPKAILLQMVANAVIDAAGGVIPVFGDLFDTVWKANTRNVDILEAYLYNPSPDHHTERAHHQHHSYNGFVLGLWVVIIAVSFILVGICALLIKIFFLKF